MAHPVLMISELSKLYPTLPIQMWVYGVFNTTLPHAASGVKGILAATESRLIFFGKEKDDQNVVLEIGFEEIKSITFQSGPFAITCGLVEGGYLEMSLISRGDSEGLAALLKNECGKSLEEN
ncbi:MAG TPA: hypothetical protein VK947_01700 [Planococcus sp. (in: firmicutes)]|nr:hypothetical protein [Planococcus sp. (in: firmicutes)]